LVGGTGVEVGAVVDVGRGVLVGGTGVEVGAVVAVGCTGEVGVAASSPPHAARISPNNASPIKSIKDFDILASVRFPEYYSTVPNRYQSGPAGWRLRHI
jgi:hypothetical protein